MVNYSSWFAELEKQIIDIEPVALHIRRGDYKELSDSFGLLSSKYYEEAIASLKTGLKMAPIWVFSDDIEAAKHLLRFLDFNFTFVEQPDDLNPLESLILMSKCSGIITANSSFSWWAAALASNAKQVIAPTKWFKSLSDPSELIPKNWTRVTSNWV